MNDPFYRPKEVQKLLDLSGSGLRKIVARGIVQPRRDANGTYLYSQAEVDQLIAYRSKILRSRLECDSCE